MQAAQSQLIQSARMATIGEVASGVAHQIYNPLTTIIADAQILLRSLAEDHPGRESAEAIEQAGWRLQQVVQRLMEFSRPAGETLEPVSVIQTIQSAISLVYTKPGNRGLPSGGQSRPAAPNSYGQPAPARSPMGQPAPARQRCGQNTVKDIPSRFPPASHLKATQL